MNTNMKVEYIRNGSVFSFDHVLSKADQILFYAGNLNPDGQYEREHIVYDPIPELKQELYDKIDAYVQAEIFKGFVYNGKTFSMSLKAQINWSNILLIPNGNFPLSLMTIDEELVQLPVEEKIAFHQASLSHKYSKLQLGHTLKTTVKNFTTVEELNTFILE
jgi:hypothetical protein